MLNQEGVAINNSELANYRPGITLHLFQFLGSALPLLWDVIIKCSDNSGTPYNPRSRAKNRPLRGQSKRIPEVREFKKHASHLVKQKEWAKSILKIVLISLNEEIHWNFNPTCHALQS